MESINCYVSILVALLAFFCAILMYLKYGVKSSFDKVIPGINNPAKPNNIINDEVHLLDTRNKFSTLAPVNPIVERSQVLNVIPANQDLYTTQDASVDYYLLDQPKVGNTNQLIYSGGPTELIKIPLQYNVPVDEQLRSQEILITDYNKIKYDGVLSRKL